MDKKSNPVEKKKKKKKKNKKNKKKNKKKTQDPDDNHIDTPKQQLNMEPKDYISCFPDDIIFRIICFLPFESAVTTTFLSKRWNGLWRKTFVVDTTMEDAVVTIFNLVYDFAQIHPLPNKWGLQLNLGQGRLLLASITPNQTLHLDFSAAHQELPTSFDWFLPLCLPWRNQWPSPYEHDEEIMDLNPPLSFDRRFKLKSLYLVSVSQFCSKALTSLVSSLPFLESLIIKRCNGLQSLVVQDAGTLQKLIVLDCPQLQSVSFFGAHLKCFRYRGNLVSFRFQACCRCGYIDVFSPYYCDCGIFLEDVMLDFRQGPLTQWTWNFETFCFQGSCGCGTGYECFKSILKTIRWTESLTICRCFFEKTMCNNLYGSSKGPEFYFSQLKELWWIDCSMTRQNINALLSFLKLCPKLERLYVTIDPKCYNLTSSSTERFSAIVSAPKNLSSLKVVKLEGFVDEQRENYIARRLIPIFGKNKEPVIISKSDGKCSKQLVKVSKLEKEGKYPYKFKMVENVDENFLDHVHMNL